MYNRIELREWINDALRVFIDCAIKLCAIVFRFVQVLRMRSYNRDQAKLRRKYGIETGAAVHSYDETTRRNVELRYKQLGRKAVYAYTSGSTSEPKKIVYDNRRLRESRMIFVEALFQYLALLPERRSLFIFSSLLPDRTLTSLLLQEKGLPPYLSGLQAPHRVQHDPAIHMMARKYGQTSVRLWMLAISNPGLIYSTNPSTIATFLKELHEDWPSARACIVDYLNDSESLPPELKRIHRRIASRGSRERLERIAKSQSAPTINVLLPGLRGYCCWDGGYVGPFLRQIRSYLPQERYTHFPMYSMSTETVETVPILRGSDPFFVPMAPGVLYEFLEEGKADRPENLITARSLKPGAVYSMVVSDAYGLQRYQTEDLFSCEKFVGKLPDLRFLRRRNLSYSFTGEKLTGEQLKLAYQAVDSHFPELGRNGFLTCFPSLTHSQPHYKLIFVQTGGPRLVHPERIGQAIERELAAINPEFRSKMESRRLGSMTFESLPLNEFARRLGAEDRPGSQFKFLPLYTRLWETTGRMI